MRGTQDGSLETIGLAGDGDEVAAVEAIERHFAVRLNYDDASNWRTAGDLYASLLEALPSGQRDDPDVWPVFAALLCDDSGADAKRVGPDTQLLGLPLRTVIGRWFGRRLRPNL